MSSLLAIHCSLHELIAICSALGSLTPQGIHMDRITRPRIVESHGFRPMPL